MSAAAGFLLGDLSAAVTGGAAGYKGALGGLGGFWGSALILGSVGATSAVVFFPVTLAAALALGAYIGSRGFEQKVKDTVCKQTDPMLAELAAEGEPKISEKLNGAFAQLQSEVGAELTALIAEEERNINQLVELNQQSQAEREHTLAHLGTVTASVGQHRLRLEQALTTAKQV
jgi:uncharacterized protein HemX